eukprot:jgi/Psemu1/2050/gm1.2050_g
MRATVSSMNKNWGILYVGKQLGAIMSTIHEYKVHKELKKAKAKEITAHNVKTGKLTKAQKETGQWLQDFYPKKILKQTFPQCGHFNIMELQSAKEIERINKNLEHEHLIKIRQWENKSAAVKLKTRKPRKKPT